MGFRVRLPIVGNDAEHEAIEPKLGCPPDECVLHRAENRLAQCLRNPLAVDARAVTRVQLSAPRPLARATGSAGRTRAYSNRIGQRGFEVLRRVDMLQSQMLLCLQQQL